MAWDFQGRKHVTELVDLEKEAVIKFSGVAEIAQSKSDELARLGATGVQVTTNDRDLIESSDAAIICTPNESHYDIAQDWVKAGKHILVEKPVTTNYLKGLKLLKDAKEKGVYIVSGLMYRFSRQLYWAKETVASGELGKIRGVHLRTVTPTREGHGLTGDLFWDLLPHPLDICCQLFGSLPSFSQKVVVPHRSHAFVLYLYDQQHGGFPVTVEAAWGLPEKHRSLEIMGERLSLSCDMASDPMFVYLTKPLSGLREARWYPPNNTLEAQLRSFVRGCQERPFDYGLMQAAVDGLELIEKTLA